MTTCYCPNGPDGAHAHGAGQCRHTPPPLPEVTMRPAQLEHLPASARLLLKELDDGWTWTAHYARGPVPQRTNVDGRQQLAWKTVDSYTVRLRNRAANAAAMGLWVDGAFEMGGAWITCTCDRQEHPGHIPVKLNLEQLYLVVGPDVEWWAA